MLITLHSFYPGLFITILRLTQIYVLTFNANICFAFQYPSHLIQHLLKSTYNENRFLGKYQLILHIVPMINV